jgi:4-amino-4-deoxy-L-arabinose transferase-like glycosyltransferase
MEDLDRRNMISPVHNEESRNGEKETSRLAQAVFVLLCAETLFSVPYRSIYLLRHSIYQAWITAICVLAAIGVCFAFRQPVLRALGRMLSSPSKGNKAWLSFWLIFGLALRLAWALRFPIPLQSDNLIFFDVAAKMAHGQSMGSVFNPPGLSLFLAPFFMVFGAHQWVTLLCALLLFVATYLLTYALASRIQGGLAARIAPMLVAVWPGYFPLAGVNSKETLLAALVPATLFLYLKAFDPGAGPHGARIHWGYVIAAGLCMGFAALTQPGYLLFPAVLFSFEMLRAKGWRRATGRTAVFTIAMLAAILPWTFRNYLVFHRVVLISTNGGSVFYRANNADANAQYEPENEAPLPKDEFEADKMGYKLADDWIEHHPGAFAVLMVRKQVVFLGDDALGSFATLKYGRNSSVAFYAIAKAVSNLFWLALWAVLFFGFPLLFKMDNWRLWFGLLFLPLLYQWVIDSVFESGPRHHVPYVALIAVLVGMVLGLAVQPASTFRQVSPQP